MPGLADLMAYIDQKKRLVGRNLSDLVENPNAVGEQWSDQLQQDVPEMMQDPGSYVGGGVGRIKMMGRAGDEYSAPTQAELAGRLHYLGLASPRNARDIYNLGGKKAVDPELLKLIEDEAVMRGRARY
jgi:hypothetical protein